MSLEKTFIKVNVKPNKGRFSIYFKNGVLTVETKSKADRGKANLELKKKLSSFFKTNVKIIKGHKSTKKLLEILKNKKKVDEILKNLN